MAKYCDVFSICVFGLVVLIMGSICIWTCSSHISTTETEDLSYLEADSEYLKNSEAEGELIFVHVLYRHGDRNPVNATPGSSYTDLSYWPEGWGQLTALGKQQGYALGLWLRRRYNKYISNEYDGSEIYVRSSDVDRTIMSAQSVLAAMYPPRGKLIWKRNLLWQPIPVHTVPANLDYLVAAVIPNCTSYLNATKRYLASDEMKDYLKSIQPIFDNFTLHTGEIINTLYQVSVMRDAWHCETTHNYTIPEWAANYYPNNDDIDQVSIRFYSQFTGTKFMSRYASGFLLKDILDRFKSKSNNTLTPNRKMWMFSSHDLTLFSFLRSLDLSDNQLVPYVSTIILEMRKRDDEYYVQIFYKTSDKTPEPIQIPGCGTQCPLSKMYEIYDHIIPKKQFDDECEIPEQTDQL
ncbi:prostatic acid phosphatase-like [Bradysia coprophila]|uniref:prostatic acid phosphatase-like n=1 Tax=Bradysia coprophila TaxID=38358 RepID=UPI00187DC547|nr:prostatic acid phosphatase-like [Bradysia coprophila]